MKIKIKHFDELSTQELYVLLALRSEVFVVEQHCVYQDLDGLDVKGFHALMYQKDGQIIGTARILPKAVVYETPAIGRFVISKSARGEGYAHELIRACISEIERLFLTHEITISAQEHLEKFYGQHNFVRVGNGYLEDGIPHIKMKRT